MLNENKIKMMTKMAIYEKREGKKLLKTAKYDKGDFITFGILKNIIATTFAYIIIVLLYVLCNAEEIVSKFQTVNYSSFGWKIAIYYVVVLTAFSVIAGLVSSYRYEHSRKELKRYFSRLNKLERFYNNHRRKK